MTKLQSYEIRRMQVYKNYVFLLSVVTFSLGTSAMWTTHNVERLTGMFTIDDMKKYFQKDHDRQIRKMIREEEEREPAEFKIPSIHDLTVKAVN